VTGNRIIIQEHGQQITHYIMNIKTNERKTVFTILPHISPLSKVTGMWFNNFQFSVVNLTTSLPVHINIFIGCDDCGIHLHNRIKYSSCCPILSDTDYIATTRKRHYRLSKDSVKLEELQYVSTFLNCFLYVAITVDYYYYA
jgi:hypothetical protein